MRHSNVLLLGVLCAFFGMATAPAMAGLSGHVDAYNGWSGSTSFDSSAWGGDGSLAGYVEWAVFGPGDFPYAGYTPTPGELTYAYQVFNTGTEPISQFSLVLENQADNEGWFTDLVGVEPQSVSLTPLSDVTWAFGSLVTEAVSTGLAFSSPQLPQDFLGAVVDGGQGSYVIPLPTPSANSIPEPAAVSLLVVSSMVLVRRRTR